VSKPLPAPSNWINAPPVTCFPRAARAREIRVFEIDAALGSAHVEGLAALLPILGCGEEAASLAFDGLAMSINNDPVGRAALARIAKDEDHHDHLICRLRAALPPPPAQREIMRTTRRFHMKLGIGEVPVRLAAIAGLDSAVCSILGRLLHRKGVLAAAPAVHAVLSAIHQDEARHVAVSRSLALARADGDQLRPIAMQARNALSDIMLRAGQAFERLEVDTAMLVNDIRRLPAGLLP
jgi:hypothetical protein